MGNAQAAEIDHVTRKSDDGRSAVVKPKILCLHGWRTSGKILSMQTAALRYHTNMDCTFVDAPFAALGPPDSGIAFYYPDMPYYEWYHKSDADVQTSIDFVMGLLREGHYDGMLGFSQGAGMVTRMLKLIETQNEIKLKFVILIGGVPPHDTSGHEEIVLQTPSLHIMGLADYVLTRSQALERMYDKSTSKTLVHQENHRIPSMKTGLYPDVKVWLTQFS